MALVEVVQQRQRERQEETSLFTFTAVVGMLLLGRRLRRLRLPLLMREMAQTLEGNPRRQSLPQVRCLRVHISLVLIFSNARGELRAKETAQPAVKLLLGLRSMHKHSNLVAVWSGSGCVSVNFLPYT